MLQTRPGPHIMLYRRRKHLCLVRLPAESTPQSSQYVYQWKREWWCEKNIPSNTTNHITVALPVQIIAIRYFPKITQPDTELHKHSAQGLYAIIVDCSYLKRRCWPSMRAQAVGKWTGMTFTSNYRSKDKKYIQIPSELLNTRHKFLVSTQSIFAL